MNVLAKVRRYRWYVTGRWQLKKLIQKSSAAGKLKIVLGAGLTNHPGWISTDLPHFNILLEKDWEYFFSGLSIDNMLAEHVLEHLTSEEVATVISISYRYLNRGGCFRIAVPDAYHPDPEYIKVTHPPVQGHQSIWNVDSLQKILTETGYRTEPLEYYTADGVLKTINFDFKSGYIIRSKAKGFQSPIHHDYSSLIIDSFK